MLEGCLQQGRAVGGKKWCFLEWGWQQYWLGHSLLNSRCDLSTVQIPFFFRCPACWVYSFPQTSLPFQNFPFTSSCRQTLTSWAPARSKMGSAYLGDQGWSTAQGEGCFLHCWETAGLADRRPRGAASNSLWLWRQLDLCKLCLRPSLCPHLQILVYTCPELPYQMMPNHAEMSGSFAM